MLLVIGLNLVGRELNEKVSHDTMKSSFLYRKVASFDWYLFDLYFSVFATSSSLIILITSALWVFEMSYQTESDLPHYASY